MRVKAYNHTEDECSSCRHLRHCTWLLDAGKTAKQEVHFLNPSFLCLLSSLDREKCSLLTILNELTLSISKKKETPALKRLEWFTSVQACGWKELRQ